MNLQRTAVGRCLASSSSVAVRYRSSAKKIAMTGNRNLCCALGRSRRGTIGGINHKYDEQRGCSPLLLSDTYAEKAIRCYSTSSGGKKSYPTQEEIWSLFKKMSQGDYKSFFSRVHPQVDWTVMGTHPCAGRYESLEAFQKGTLARLGKIMKEPGLRLSVRNVIGGGDHEWATVELVAKAECLNGFKFDNTYAWCCKFDEHGMIVQVRAYLDSWMVQHAVVENETPSHRAHVPDVEQR